MNELKDLIITKKDLRKRIQQVENNNEDNTCLIFGAGASYGYCNSPIYYPPTVKQLFDESNEVVGKVLEYPKHKSIKSNKDHYTTTINNYHDNDLEKYLSSLYISRSEDKIFSNLIGYLEDIFFLSSKNVSNNSNNNNYQALVNRMFDIHKKRDWSCISFNYDTIFEQSYLLADRDIQKRSFASIGDYIYYKNPLILKMHGSINFRYIYKKPHLQSDIDTHSYQDIFPKMMNDDREISEFLQVIGVDINKPEFYLKKYSKLSSDSESVEVSQFNLPNILIPIHSKIETLNKLFATNIELAKESINKSNLIIAIGYNFGDEFFMKSLGETDFSKKEIIIVGTQKTMTNTGSDLVNEIKKTWANAKIRIFDGDGFGEFVKAIQ